jgi:hypothetical protein
VNDGALTQRGRRWPAHPRFPVRADHHDHRIIDGTRRGHTSVGLDVVQDRAGDYLAVVEREQRDNGALTEHRAGGREGTFPSQLRHRVVSFGW